MTKTRPGTVYAGVQGQQWGKNTMRGVFKTTNSGKSWDKILYVNDGVGIADLVADPTNPNKLIAAMWEFSRTPAFFNSGGPGSGSLHYIRRRCKLEKINFRRRPSKRVILVEWELQFLPQIQI